MDPDGLGWWVSWAQHDLPRCTVWEGGDHNLLHFPDYIWGPLHDPTNSSPFPVPFLKSSLTLAISVGSLRNEDDDDGDDRQPFLWRSSQEKSVEQKSGRRDQRAESQALHHPAMHSHGPVLARLTNTRKKKRARASEFVFFPVPFLILFWGFCREWRVYIVLTN